MACGSGGLVTKLTASSACVCAMGIGLIAGSLFERYLEKPAIEVCQQTIAALIIKQATVERDFAKLQTEFDKLPRCDSAQFAATGSLGFCRRDAERRD
jgi:hypothetical protein